MLVGCTVGGANAIRDSANQFNIINIILLLQVLTHTLHSPDVFTGVDVWLADDGKIDPENQT